MSAAARSLTHSPARLAVPLPPNGCCHPPRGCGIPQSHPKTLLCPKSSPWASFCVCLGPSKSNIAPDLCAPGSLCTPRQTGIFSGVCSHSRKNSQMGITLPRGTGCVSFIYNAGQHQELLSAALSWGVLPSWDWSCDFLVSAQLGAETRKFQNIQKCLLCGVRCKWELSTSDSDFTWSPECEL